MPALRLLNCIHFALVAMSIVNMAVASARPEHNLVNFKEIKMFASFAQASYSPLAEIRKPDFLNEYTLTHYGTVPEFNIFYFLAFNPFYIIFIIFQFRFNIGYFLRNIFIKIIN